MSKVREAHLALARKNSDPFLVAVTEYDQMGGYQFPTIYSYSNAVLITFFLPTFQPLYRITFKARICAAKRNMSTVANPATHNKCTTKKVAYHPKPNINISIPHQVKMFLSQKQPSQNSLHQTQTMSRKSPLRRTHGLSFGCATRRKSPRTFTHFSIFVEIRFGEERLFGW